MLLEMQSAMNNMMNNNQLNSSQTISIGQALTASATEATSEDTSTSSARSPSSQSDSSSDPEPTVAMDTSPSSASPSSSDSGEEEVIGSVTRAHQETFMYNQEQSSLSAEASTSTGPLNNGSTQSTSNNHHKEELQDSWNNHHNNMVTISAQDSSADLGPRRQEDNSNHCPFRLSRTAATSHCPAYNHGAFRAPPTEGHANGGFNVPHWRGGNRMYLVRYSDRKTISKQKS